MTTHALLQPPPAEACMDLQTFFDRVRSTNPFTDNRVNSPSAADVDVPDIHRLAFERQNLIAHLESGLFRR